MTRDEIKDRIHADPQPIYALMEKAKDGKSYVCPFCRHGEGGDGIILNQDQGGKFHCFACEQNGDAIDIYQKIKGIADFNTALAEVANLYGLQIEQSKPVDPATLTPEEKQRRIDSMAAADIRRAQANQSHPDYIAYLKQRGISPELAHFFGLGFIPDWRHPKTVTEGKNPPPSPRLIIPTGKVSYTARDTRPAGEIPETAQGYTKSKVGKVEIFNAAAIRNATRPLFIVEGEIDAISFYAAGGQAVAIGSTSNVNKLLQELEKAGRQRTREPFIIALDNDDAGRKATETLTAGLDHLRIKYTIANPAGEYKDANEALQKDPAGFTERVRKAERAELDAESNAAYIERLKKDFSRTPEPIPTGFTYLDDLLDGGLLAGLYFIGGVSSSGKTALSMQIIDQVAKAGGNCLVFAAEMSRADLIARSISRETVLNGADHFLYFTQREVQAGYRFCEYSEGRLDNLDKAYQAYQQYAGRISIYENKGDTMKPSRIRQKIERYCYLTGSRPLILIDYLQILTPEDNRQDIRFCIDDTIRALKGISTEFCLPIIVISSLNRDNYTTPLNLAAFKESGNIEYAADYLLGLQFSIVHEFDPKNKPAENLEILAQEKNKPIRDVEITILKQRGGKSAGAVRFSYDARHNLYQQSQTVEEYLQANFPDRDDQREHRKNLTGHAISADDRPAPIQPTSRRAKPL